jgi:hypothetical protein
MLSAQLPAPAGSELPSSLRPWRFAAFGERRRAQARLNAADQIIDGAVEVMHHIVPGVTHNGPTQADKRTVLSPVAHECFPGAVGLPSVELNAQL